MLDNLLNQLESGNRGLCIVCTVQIQAKRVRAFVYATGNHSALEATYWDSSQDDFMNVAITQGQIVQILDPNIYSIGANPYDANWLVS